MSLQFKWSRFESLGVLELYEIIRAREAVFVVEQACPYQEVDGMDISSWHLSVTMDGELAAYARLVDPGVKYLQPSIGRVMTVKKFRSLKIGRALMTEAIRFSESQFPGQSIKIGAQVYLNEFYGSFGFEAVSDPYDEDGILHIDMIRPS